MTTALLLDDVPPVAAHALQTLGWTIRTAPTCPDLDRLTSTMEDVDVVGVRPETRVGDHLLAQAQAPALAAVGVFGLATHAVDVVAATRRGIAVFNAPFSNSRSVVELAVAEIIALTRRLSQKNAALHGGVWDKSAEGAHEVRGRTLGIVGYGRIGSQLSILAEALGMNVLFFDIADRLAVGNARRCSSLDEVLTAADVVSLHVHGAPGSAGSFGEEQFPNVILTPGVGGSTDEAQEDIGHFVAGKLYDYMTSGANTLSVNLSTPELSPSPTRHRLAHLHRNVPGVLARVNSLLADHGANVESQLLATRGPLGYLVTDIDMNYDADLIDRLSHLPESIRLRLIGR